MFEKLEERIIINTQVVAISSLHIGKSTTTAPQEIDKAVIKAPDGTPFIPGSSLKGVLRCDNDRLLNSLSDMLKNNDLKVCDLETSRLPCGECLSCLLFGGTQASSIRVKDFLAQSSKTLIRDGVAISRKTGKAITGAKYEIEVVPKGTIFDGEIMIENPKINDHKYAKLGAFLSMVNFFNNTNRSLGGGTSRGFGEVLLIVNSVRSFTANDYLESTGGKTILEFDNKKESERSMTWKFECREQEKLDSILKEWQTTLKKFRKVSENGSNKDDRL